MTFGIRNEATCHLHPEQDPAGLNDVIMLLCRCDAQGFHIL
uniref:Uncharacterized protein n=1 Tax=Anguilla anguilla TaxID=7936 RepID=A0A0E9RL29_ANGAN